jgi:hypothetical protein
MISDVKRIAVLSALTLTWFFVPGAAQAQIRGLYPPGMNATNSGVLPDAGLTYQNLFQLYTFDELKGPEGESLPVNATASLFIDQNIFLWVSKYKLLGGTYAAVAILPVTNSSLTTVAFGTIAGSAGFADSYYSSFTLGWHEKRADLQASYCFFAPTGRFTAGATDNTGAGYWGHFLSAGQTVYLTANKAAAASAFEAYEFHSTQRSTEIHPGQTFDLDYSVTQVLPLDKDQHTLLQIGVVGYGQYQTTDRTTPTVNPVVAPSSRYRVHALGPGANVLLPARKVTSGFKYFFEFSKRRDGRAALAADLCGGDVLTAEPVGQCPVGP